MQDILLLKAVQRLSPTVDAGIKPWAELATQPARVCAAVAEVLDTDPDEVIVAGPMDQRLLGVHLGATWNLANLTGQPLGSPSWPQWLRDGVELARPGAWFSPAHIEPRAVHRLRRPRVLLASLYHPEYFPLPRFPLGVSDLARAARATFSGRVDLVDMQLGADLTDVVAATSQGQTDILGISATFGQYDLLIELLDRVFALPEPPLVVAGGSLSARTERLLLDRVPRLLVSHGAGEPTIADLVAHWHGDISLERVRGVSYLDRDNPHGGRVKRTARPPSRTQVDILPELDLLPETLSRGGVAQLEISRGCTNYCSFCPRSHKGSWTDLWNGRLEWMLAQIGQIFDRHPGRSRTLYVVDEEFIGREVGATDRALEVASTLQRAGFKWETSCRVDQVVSDNDLGWHAERAQMWRALVERGLRRCLFGVESGLTSVLTRFNKETTGVQNTLAIRTLSALGVPTRFTYITFDHLMSFDELVRTWAYQGRTDLVLKPLPHLSPEEIVAGVRDEDFVRAHSAGVPLHAEISYMLVSMECLTGAPYTRAVEAAGLARGLRPSMGRVDADFADWRIGRCSEFAQRWVDRNFALDYTLKSLEKILDGAGREALRGARRLMRASSYDLLGRLIDLSTRWDPGAPDPGGLAEAIRSTLDDELSRLTQVLERRVDEVLSVLPAGESGVLTREFSAWLTRHGWNLINAAEVCDA